MNRTFWLILSGAFFLSGLASPVIGQTTSDEWSAVKDGVQGRLIFSEEPAFNGTRMLGIDLELRNVSDVGNPIEIYYDPINAFRCELLDAKNNPVAQPPLVADIMTPNPYWISLPYQGSIRFRVSVNGYGVAKDSGRMIQMSCGAWLLKPGDQAPYAFHATLSADPAREPRPHAWKGPLELPLTAVPR